MHSKAKITLEARNLFRTREDHHLRGTSSSVNIVKYISLTNREINSDMNYLPKTHANLATVWSSKSISNSD